MHSALEVSLDESVVLPSYESKSQLVNLMVQIKVEKDPNTIAGFVGQLRGMLGKLVDAQNKHKVIHAKMMKQCKGEDEFRAAEIADAKDAFARSTKARGACDASLKQAQKELPGLVSSVASYRAELERAQKQRDAERKKFEKRKQELDEAIEFLDDFIDFVGKKLKSYNSSLVEMSEKLLKHSNKLNIMEAAVPVLVAIATHQAPNANDYTFTPNEELTGRLNTALDTLANRIKSDLEDQEATEQAAVIAFNKYKAKLDEVISTLDANIKRVKKQIVDMQNCVDKEDGILSKAAAKEKRNDTLKKNAAKMCENFNKEFIEATRNRLDEIKTMGEILVIVKRRFKNLPEDLVAYLETVKNGWIEYVNSTEFQEFEEYERKKFVDNQRGNKLRRSKASEDANPEAATERGTR